MKSYREEIEKETLKSILCLCNHLFFLILNVAYYYFLSFLMGPPLAILDPPL